MIITLLFLINLVRDIPLQESSILTQRAEIRAEQLCKDNQWSHLGYENSFKGIDYDYAGENLSKDFPDDLSAFIALMQSPGHKMNILNKNYNQIGIGRSKHCNIVVELFTN
jgi:uncharacterized protein YkwD